MMNTEMIVILAVVVGMLFIYLHVGGEDAVKNVASIPGEVMTGMNMSMIDTTKGFANLVGDGTKAITGGGSITPWGRAADARRKRRKKQQKKRQKEAEAKAAEEAEREERARLAEENAFRAKWWGFSREELNRIVYVLIAVFALLFLVLLIRLARGGSDQNTRQQVVQVQMQPRAWS